MRKGRKTLKRGRTEGITKGWNAKVHAKKEPVKQVHEGGTCEAGTPAWRFIEPRGYLADCKFVVNIYGIKLAKKPSPVVLRHFVYRKLLAHLTSALVYSDEA